MCSVYGSIESEDPGGRERSARRPSSVEPKVDLNSSGERSGRSIEPLETELADAVIARLVRRGVVTAKDLAAAGVGRNAIDHRIRRKRLIPAFRGVYFVGHPDPAQFAWEYAALKAAGDGAVISHVSAAVLWGFLPSQVDPTVQVSVAAKRASRRGMACHQQNLHEGEIRTIHGDLRVTAPARTLLDLAAHPHLERMVADAIRRRLTSAHELRALLMRHRGVRHVSRLREVLDRGPMWDHSEAERRLIALIRLAELPLPESNHRTGSTSPDLVWREHRLIVEVDSRGFHNDHIAFENDRARDARRTVGGWRTIRITVKQIRDRPFYVVAVLAAALAACIGGPSPAGARPTITR